MVTKAIGKTPDGQDSLDVGIPHISRKGRHTLANLCTTNATKKFINAVIDAFATQVNQSSQLRVSCLDLQVVQGQCATFQLAVKP